MVSRVFEVSEKAFEVSGLSQVLDEAPSPDLKSR